MRIITAICLSGCLFGADGSYDTWHLDLDGPMPGRAVVTALDGRIQRVLVTFDEERRSYACYGPEVAHLDHLRVGLAARSARGSAGERLVLDATAVLWEGKNADPGRFPGVAKVVCDLGREGGRIDIAGRTYQATVRPHATDPVASGADWPRFNGPNGDFTASATAAPRLVERPEDIRLAWVSEEIMPFMAAGSRFVLAGHGGSATPVLAGGVLYQTYFTAAGDAIDPSAAKQRQPTPSPWNTLLVDEVVVAIDATTGRTRWRQVFPLAGLNSHCHKPHSQGREPVVHGDAVFVVTTAAEVLCLATADGALRWRVPSPIGGAEGAKRIAAIAGGATPQPPSNRGSGHRPVVAGGTLVVSGVWEDGGWGNNDLAGMDPATGKTLWTRSGIQAACASPVVVRLDGRELIVVTGPATKTQPRAAVRCLDPRDGSEVWQVAGLGDMPYGVTVNGDRMFVKHGGADPQAKGATGCYRITATGAQPLWRLGDDRGSVAHHFAGGCGMVVDGQAFVRVEASAKEIAASGVAGQGPAAVADDGTITAGPFPFVPGSNEGVALGLPGMLIWFPEWQHGGTRPSLFATTPLKPLGTWSPTPYLTSCGYQSPSAPPVADGRIFLRGGDGIYAFDLRRR